tara:strand:+ start:225 stop:788 length:564 start_codon:yes stop_codon:yes gene_type:complete
MKNENLLLLLFFLIVITGNNNLIAQSSYSTTTDSAGIYLTYEDFETGKLTNGFKPHQKNYSLWPQGFFKNKDVELKTPDTTIIYKLPDIWGYTDHKGRLIQVFDNRHYKVLYDKGLIIYIIYSPTKASYHFSKTLNDPIYRLTKRNLTTIYADNPEILQKIHPIKKKHWLTWDENKESYFINELFLE